MEAPKYGYKSRGSYLESQRKYRASEKHRATRRLYEKTALAAKEKRKRWRKSAKGRAYLSAWFASPKRKAWRQENRRWMRRYASDPAFKLVHNLRVRVRQVLKHRGTRKTSSAVQLLGCDGTTARVLLECQFRPGMTWKNYGKVWQVDHKKPCCSFDLTCPGQQRQCFHISNLQPLFVEENLKKGGSEWLV